MVGFFDNRLSKSNQFMAHLYYGEGIYYMFVCTHSLLLLVVLLI